MNYRFKAWASRAGKSLIFVQVSLDWLSMEVFHLMGQVLLRTPLLAPHRFLSSLERGAEILKRDFPSSGFLACSLGIILFKQSITGVTQDSRKHGTHLTGHLISELVGVWKNQCEHLGYRNMPLSPSQGGGSLVLPFSRRVERWTTCFRFQIQCLLT